MKEGLHVVIWGDKFLEKAKWNEKKSLEFLLFILR
jgi:hypothetical protein